MSADSLFFNSHSETKSQPNFASFLRDRKYLVGVSAATLKYYAHALRWMAVEKPTQGDLNSFVIRMREAGLSPTSCNDYIRAVRVYLKWAGIDLKLAKIKAPVRVLPCYTASDVARLTTHKPRKQFFPLRTHTLILLLMDTGMRIGEALTLDWASVNLNDQLVTVIGKGDRQRTIPISQLMRANLYRWRQLNPHTRVFCTRAGGSLCEANVYRYVRDELRHLGVSIPPRCIHAFRHTAATAAVRNGIDVFRLQRLLGHSDNSLNITKRYIDLQTEDLSAVCEKYSLLGANSFLPHRPTKPHR